MDVVAIVFSYLLWGDTMLKVALVLNKTEDQSYSWYIRLEDIFDEHELEDMAARYSIDYCRMICTGKKPYIKCSAIALTVKETPASFGLVVAKADISLFWLYKVLLVDGYVLRTLFPSKYAIRECDRI